jgi:hypothetical protein
MDSASASASESAMVLGLMVLRLIVTCASIKNRLDFFSLIMLAEPHLNEESNAIQSPLTRVKRVSLPVREKFRLPF